MAVKYDKLFKELKKRNVKDIEFTRATGFVSNTVMKMPILRVLV